MSLLCESDDVAPCRELLKRDWSFEISRWKLRCHGLKCAFLRSSGGQKQQRTSGFLAGATGTAASRYHRRRVHRGFKLGGADSGRCRRTWGSSPTTWREA